MIFGAWRHVRVLSHAVEVATRSSVRSIRNTYPKEFCKIGALKTFVKIHIKHIFGIKLLAKPAALLRRESDIVVFLKVL